MLRRGARAVCVVGAPLLARRACAVSAAATAAPFDLGPLQGLGRLAVPDALRTFVASAVAARAAALAGSEAAPAIATEVCAAAAALSERSTADAGAALSASEARDMLHCVAFFLHSARRAGTATVVPAALVATARAALVASAQTWPAEGLLLRPPLEPQAVVVVLLSLEKLAALPNRGDVPTSEECHLWRRLALILAPSAAGLTVPEAAALCAPCQGLLLAARAAGDPSAGSAVRRLLVCLLRRLLPKQGGLKVKEATAALATLAVLHRDVAAHPDGADADLAPIPAALPAWLPAIEAFRLDPARDTFALPPSLTPADRRALHAALHRTGIGHTSEGEGKERHMVLTKGGAADDAATPAARPARPSQFHDPATVAALASRALALCAGAVTDQSSSAAVIRLLLAVGDCTTALRPPPAFVAAVEPHADAVAKRAADEQLPALLAAAKGLRLGSVAAAVEGVLLVRMDEGPLRVLQGYGAGGALGSALLVARAAVARVQRAETYAALLEVARAVEGPRVQAAAFLRARELLLRGLAVDAVADLLDLLRLAGPSTVPEAEVGEVPTYDALEAEGSALADAHRRCAATLLPVAKAAIAGVAAELPLAEALRCVALGVLPPKQLSVGGCDLTSAEGVRAALSDAEAATLCAVAHALLASDADVSVPWRPFAEEGARLIAAGDASSLAGPSGVRRTLEVLRAASREATTPEDIFTATQCALRHSLDMAAGLGQGSHLLATAVALAVTIAHELPAPVRGGLLQDPSLWEAVRRVLQDTQLRAKSVALMAGALPHLPPPEGGLPELGRFADNARRVAGGASLSAGPRLAKVLAAIPQLRHLASGALQRCLLQRRALDDAGLCKAMAALAATAELQPSAELIPLFADEVVARGGSAPLAAVVSAVEAEGTLCRRGRAAEQLQALLLRRAPRLQPIHICRCLNGARHDPGSPVPRLLRPHLLPALSTVDSALLCSLTAVMAPCYPGDAPLWAAATARAEALGVAIASPVHEAGMRPQ